MENRPKVSVIIPSYNSSKVIAGCLQSVLDQDYEGEIEILVVDDGSIDSTLEVLKNFAVSSQRADREVKIIPLPHKGPAAARNYGAKMARGDMLLFLDSDCLANPHWARFLVDDLTESVVGGVGGSYRTLNPERRVAKYIGYDIEYRHTRINRSTDFIGSYSMALNKQVFNEVKGFDETFASANAEDTDLSYRIREKGYLLLFEPRGWVWHKHPSTLSKFFKQQMSRAVWRIYLLRKRPSSMKGDNYAGRETLIQPLVWYVSWLVGLLLIITRNISFLSITLLSPLPILAIININFLSFCHEKEPSISFTLFCYFAAISRSFSWALGGIIGVIRYSIFQSPSSKLAR